MGLCDPCKSGAHEKHTGRQQVSIKRKGQPYGSHQIECTCTTCTGTSVRPEKFGRPLDPSSPIPVRRGFAPPGPGPMPPERIVYDTPQGRVWRVR